MTTIRNIKGFSSKSRGDILEKSRVRVFVTSDDFGEMLSLLADGHMITVDYGIISRIMERERAHKYKNEHYIIEEEGEDDAGE